MSENTNPNIGAAYEITVFNVDGTVKQVIQEEAKCFVLNFLRLIKNLLSNGGDANYTNLVVYTNFRNLAGAVVQSAGYLGATTPNSGFGAFLANGASGDITRGVVVGSGSTPVTADDYKLESIIAHGTGVGQLSYDMVAIQKMPPVGSTIVIAVTRIVSNNSAAPVSFSELGIYQVGQAAIMTLRDVIASPVVLNLGESALIAYKIIING